MSYAAIALIVGFAVIMATVKILRQYERAVVFTHPQLPDRNLGNQSHQRRDYNR